MVKRKKLQPTVFPPRGERQKVHSILPASSLNQTSPQVMSVKDNTRQITYRNVASRKQRETPKLKTSGKQDSGVRRVTFWIIHTIRWATAIVILQGNGLSAPSIGPPVRECTTSAEVGFTKTPEFARVRTFFFGSNGRLVRKKRIAPRDDLCRAPVKPIIAVVKAFSLVLQ